MNRFEKYEITNKIWFKNEIYETALKFDENLKNLMKLLKLRFTNPEFLVKNYSINLII